MVRALPATGSSVLEEYPSKLRSYWKLSAELRAGMHHEWAGVQLGVGEHLPSEQEAWGSIPSNAKQQ